MSTRWIIVITSRPSVCIDLDGNVELAVRRATEAANEHRCACLLIGNLGGPWRQYGTFSPQRNHEPKP